MNQEALRRRLAQDLPDYEIVPESPLEDAAPDEPTQVDANAGSVNAWRKANALINERPEPPEWKRETNGIY